MSNTYTNATNVPKRAVVPPGRDNENDENKSLKKMKIKPSMNDKGKPPHGLFGNNKNGTNNNITDQFSSSIQDTFSENESDLILPTIFQSLGGPPRMPRNEFIQKMNNTSVENKKNGKVQEEDTSSVSVGNNDVQMPTWQGPPDVIGETENNNQINDFTHIPGIENEENFDNQTNHGQANPVWKCTMCTSQNEHEYDVCRSCNTRRDNQIIDFIPVHIPGIEHEENSDNQTHGLMMAQTTNDESPALDYTVQVSNYGQADPVWGNLLEQQSRKWKCTMCTSQNEHEYDVCRSCNTRRGD